MLALLSLASVSLLGSPAAIAQTVDPSTVTSFSQYLRAIGHNITPAEATFLDADERIQASFTQALVNVDLLSRVDPSLRNDEWRQALEGELNRVIAMNPSDAPAALHSPKRLRELGVEQRTYVWRAARQWLDGLQGGDPEWLQRGVDDFRAAMQGMANWQQEIVSRFPPPEQPQP